MQTLKIARFTSLIALVALLLAQVSRVRAEPQWIVGQPSDERRMSDLSFGAGVGGLRGVAGTFGAMFAFPVLDAGFIPPVNDAILLEPGLFLGVRHRKDDTYLWVIPEIGPRWNFYLTPNWDAHASLKVGWAIGSHGAFWARGLVGMQWWFARPWALRVETNAGYPVGPGLFLGLSYQFL